MPSLSSVFSQREATFLAQAQTYCQQTVAPVAAHLDRSPPALQKAIEEMGKRQWLALRVPVSWGGLGLSKETFARFQMLIARYSGALAFVQTQHQSAARLLAASEHQALKQSYLPQLATGKKLMGVGFSHLRRPKEPLLKALPVTGGYELTGKVPWVTGWGIFEEWIVGASLPSGEAVDGIVVRQELGVVGLRIAWELRGLACLPLQLSQPAKKSLMVSRSFRRLIESLAELKEAIATFNSRAGEKLRRYGLAASAVKPFIATNRFGDNPQAFSVRVSLPVSTNDTAELLYYVLLGTETLYQEGLAYKKAGVMVLKLVDEHIQQLHLWDTRALALASPRRERARYAHLMETLDRLNRKRGSGTLSFAVAGLDKSWLPKCERRSPRYTTQWDELPIVKANPVRLNHPSNRIEDLLIEDSLVTQEAQNAADAEK